MLLLSSAGCGFVPDLTRFDPCDEEGRCPAGTTCVLPETRCIPDCLTCAPFGEDDGGEDGGTDAGVDGGDDDDSGVDAGSDGGDDGGEDDAGEIDAGEIDAGSLWVAPSLERGVEGIAFALTIAVDGGTAPYQFDPLSSSIPAPMTLHTAGVLSGTPPPVGATPVVFLLQATVTDSSATPLVADASVSWEVHPLLRFAGPQLLTSATNNKPYLETLSAHGGVAPYTFTIVEGSFPSGFSFDDGVIEGQGTTGSAAEVTIRVTDSAAPPQEVTGVVHFECEAGTFGVDIKTRQLPSGRVGAAYSYSLVATGGTPGYTWSVEDGPLPVGITLSESGQFSGEPEQPGAYQFTVRAEDSVLTAQTLPLSITVH